MLTQLYRLEEDGSESRFWVEHSEPLSERDQTVVRWLVTTTYRPWETRDVSVLEGKVTEIGPRLSMETPESSNAVDMCCGAGVMSVTRFEMSRRFSASAGVQRAFVLMGHLDPLTQQEYPPTLTTLMSDAVPESVQIVDILGESGAARFAEVNKRLGLGLDEEDRRFFTVYFRRQQRNPTDVELVQIGNMVSDHCRHRTWNGKVVIDGVEMPHSLMWLAKAPLQALQHPGSTLKAFNDNSGVLTGVEIDWLQPMWPDRPSSYTFRRGRWCIAHTAETHNHPTAIAPYPGAATGRGGELRDEEATGCGAISMAGFSGYCIARLVLSGYKIPGQLSEPEEIPGRATALRILIEGSNGLSDYGNQFGKPLIGGFCRSLDVVLPDGERQAYLKPVLYSAGVSRVPELQAEKQPPQAGMLVIRIGGRAFRVGVGGGSASSLMPGESTHMLDLQSVQRGNACVQNGGARVIARCAEMGERNPICSLHDQGAGGPSNVLTELLEERGGELDIRRIASGDPTLSVRELWSAEFQEGYGLLLWSDRLDEFRAICDREGVNCEVLGKVTGDGFVRVQDSSDGSTPVELELAAVTADLPKKTLNFTRVSRRFESLTLPDVSVAEALERIFKLLSVGSKGFLVHKADRSVGGLVVQQQCCGPMQIPVADAGVVADSFVGFTGGVSTLGERPTILLLDAAAGARMAVGEALTNMAGALVSDFSDIRFRANWMVAMKCDGEGARVYDADEAKADLLQTFEQALDGGKDSSSMATQVGGEIVKSPAQLVMFANVRSPDVRRVVTPDLKRAGSCLGFINLAPGKHRLGGSSLAQVYDQLGHEPPDLDDPDLLRRSFRAVQELVERGLILSYHDRSEGGFITTLVEMCLAGNLGASIRLSVEKDHVIPILFNEELGMVIEFSPEDAASVRACFDFWGVPWMAIGHTVAESVVTIGSAMELFFQGFLQTLRQWWEATSSRLDEEQASRATVQAERESFVHESVPPYVLSFTPRARLIDTTSRATVRPAVAILRERGTNGDTEMAAAFQEAGLDPKDVAMSDLREGRTTLDQFQGLVFCGGFSNKDVLGSAVGWAAAIRFHADLREQFDRFYDRPDTFSLGVCNGCQLMALLGWVPWRGIPDVQQPRFIRNTSQRFESRWSRVEIQPSPAILLRGMEGSHLGIHVAHGEGRAFFPEMSMLRDVLEERLAPLAYVGPDGYPTQEYPYNPNGSPDGITALCSLDGRHLAMMPHPERCFRMVQWPHAPESWKRGLEVSPWLQMFQNARAWCLSTSARAEAAAPAV